MNNKVEGNILNANGWADRYQRNNKRSGVKNLRCFPSCSQPHHMEKGYCGRPVTLSLKRTSYLDKIEIFAWAEFKTIEEIPRVRVGSTITALEVKSLTRSRIDIYKPWYRGDIIRPTEHNKNEILVLFNTSKKGWNYNWAATRNSAMVKHVLICYVCTLDEYQEGTFKCIGIFESPHFAISCRKQNNISISSLKKAGVMGKNRGGGDDDDDDEDEDEDEDDDDEGNEVAQQQQQQQPIRRGNAAKSSNQHKAAIQRGKHSNMQQNPSQIPFIPDLDFFNDVDAILDSKDEYNPNAQEGFDPIKSLFSTSSMSNLFLPSGIPAYAEPRYNHENETTIGWLPNQSSSSSSSMAPYNAPSMVASRPALGPASGPRRPQPPSTKTTTIFDDEETWKRMLGPASNSHGFNWNFGTSLLMGFSNSSNNNNNSSSSSSSLSSSNFGSANQGNVTNNKRRDTDSASNGSSEEDVDRHIIRLCILLDKIEEMLKESGAASKMGVPQFVLEEFLQEIGNVGFDDDTSNGISSLAGSMVFNMSQIEPISDTRNDVKEETSKINPNAARLIEEFMGFLLNESQITASLKSLANSRKLQSASSSSAAKDERVRKMEFINVFHKHLETFLSSKGLTAADLDRILQVPKKDDVLVSKALKKFEEEVRRYVEDEDAFEQRKRSRITGPLSSSIGYNPHHPTNTGVKTVDFTGEWRLDDALLEAFDSFRAIRGLPWFIRQVLTYMERKVIAEHLPDRMLIRLNRKLLSTGCLEYLLDKQLHELNSNGPLPWASPTLETYRAWIEDDTYIFIHYYEQNLRSKRAVKKNATGDRLEVVVSLQELQVPSQRAVFDDDSQWRTISERTGYALREPSQQ